MQTGCDMFRVRLEENGIVTANSCSSRRNQRTELVKLAKPV